VGGQGWLHGLKACAQFALAITESPNTSSLTFLRAPPAGKQVKLKQPQPPSFRLVPSALKPALRNQFVDEFSLAMNLTEPLLQPLPDPLRLLQR
jgi:hypothetical protein